MSTRSLFGIVALLAAFLAGRVSTHIELPFPLTIVIDDGPPVPGEGKHVLVIYETEDRISMPRDQRSIIDSVPLREWLKESGVDAKFLDPQSEIVHSDAWFKAAIDANRESLPWMIVSNGKAGFSGPLPGTVDEFKTIVERYAK